VLNWLEALVDDQCSAPPTIVGQVLGGALGARFAATRSNRLSGLVLVDSLGLGRFRPSPRFALTMAGFLARPSERSYNRFMRQCSFDLDGLRDQMGERWDAFVDYNIDLARSPKAKAAGRLMRKVGLPRIPAAELERIAVPTTLIWGRQDRAIRLRIAEAASARFGWRLRVIEDCADDPPRDRPAEFLSALRPALPS
jgi:pimeloyl-ACP methyl ester carboxylesterase